MAELLQWQTSRASLAFSQPADEIKTAEEAIPRLQPSKDREMVEDFLESGEHR